jgi:hypothetical protein
VAVESASLNSPTDVSTVQVPAMAAVAVASSATDAAAVPRSTRGAGGGGAAAGRDRSGG